MSAPNHESCIPIPNRGRFLFLRQWQVEACGGDLCAASLLTFFISWHDHKLAQREKAAQLNDVAEKHGEPRTQDEHLYLWFTEPQLQVGLMDLYKRMTIRKGLKTLEALGFISIHNNPNPAYRFDRTRYFRLYPEKIIACMVDHGWLQPFAKSLQPFLANRAAENGPPSAQNSPPLAKNSPPINENTSSNTNEDTLRGEDLPLPPPTSAWGTPEALVAWWNDTAVPLGCPRFDPEDLTEKMRTKCKAALKNKPAQAFWEDRVAKELALAPFLRSQVTPRDGRKRFVLTFDKLLGIHRDRQVEYYLLVAQGEYRKEDGTTDALSEWDRLKQQIKADQEAFLQRRGTAGAARGP
jgi:hypothetical protein